MTPIALGAALGALLGLLAVPCVRRLPLGIPERAPQPDWTSAAERPRWLVLAGAAAGAVAAAAPADAGGRAVVLVLAAVLVPIAAIDLRWRVVPDSLVLAGALGAVGVLAVAAPERLGAHLLAGALVGGGLLAVALAARGGLGGGDVKLGAMLGLALGPGVGRALVLAGALGVVVGLVVRVRRGRGATLPLAPILAIAAVASAGLPMAAAATPVS